MRKYRTPIQTEATAWQYVADLLEEKGSKVLRSAGLCYLVDALASDRIIAWQTQIKMESRIEREIIALNNGPYTIFNHVSYQHYLFPKGRSAPRIILAQLWALEAAAENRREAAERRRIAKLAWVDSVELGADELEEIKQFASRDEDEDDGYVARQNALVEGAEEDEIEAGAGSDGYDLDTRESDAAPW